MWVNRGLGEELSEDRPEFGRSSGECLIRVEKLLQKYPRRDYLGHVQGVFGAHEHFSIFWMFALFFGLLILFSGSWFFLGFYILSLTF